MTTTDSNGIVFMEETDAISPFHTLMNTLQTGTTNAVGALKSGGMRVALGGSGQNIPNGTTTTLNVGTPSSARVSPGWSRTGTTVVTGDTGILTVTLQVTPVSGGAFTGRHFIEIIVDGDAHRNSLYGEPGGAFTISRPASAGAVISCQIYQASGSTREYTGNLTAVVAPYPKGWS